MGIIRFITRNIGYICTRYTKEYYIRSYIIAIIFWGISVAALNHKGAARMDEVVALGISAALYPFIRFNYFRLKYLILGDVNFTMGCFLFFFFKFVVFIILFALSIPVGIIDIVYILAVNNSQRYIENKRYREEKDQEIEDIINKL